MNTLRLRKALDAEGFVVAGRCIEAAVGWHHRYPNADPKSLSELEQIARHEGLEATDPKDALEMYAWDLGYQGLHPSTWMIELGRQLRVEVKKVWQSGRAEGLHR